MPPGVPNDCCTSGIVAGGSSAAVYGGGTVGSILREARRQYLDGVGSDMMAASAIMVPQDACLVGSLSLPYSCVTTEVIKENPFNL